MTTTITGLLKHIHVSNNNFDDIHPDRVLTTPVKMRRGSLENFDPYWAGCALHAALRRLEDAAPLSAHEKLLWPYVAELRSALERLGVSSIRVERALEEWGGLPHGSCDLSVSGGMRPCGIIEVKVVKELPVTPRPRDLTQLGGYLRLAARTSRFENWWGGVVYVSLAQSSIRLCLYGDVRPLVLRSSALLKAA